MTQNGWCRSNYHKDGKRRFGLLTNGLCAECYWSDPAQGTFAANEVKAIETKKITRLIEKINDLEEQRSLVNQEIYRLRNQLQALVTKNAKSGVTKNENRS